MNVNGVRKSKVALAIVMLLLGITPALLKFTTKKMGFNG